MIDIENIIFDECSARVLEKFPNAEIGSIDINSYAKSPTVLIFEADNAAYDKTADSSSNENHAVLMYQVSVTSNKNTGKKAECKAILKIIDKYFTSKGFTRIGKDPPTITDEVWCRMVTRYRAVVSQDNIIYRR